MDFFDRLDKYMEESGLNDNKLTVLAQLSVGALGKQRKGGRGLSVDSVAKILHACPNLNAEWLLTGEGKMLKDKMEVFHAMPSSQDPAIQLILERDEKLIRENERLKIQLETTGKGKAIKIPPPAYIPDKQ